MFWKLILSRITWEVQNSRDFHVSDLLLPRRIHSLPSSRPTKTQTFKGKLRTLATFRLPKRIERSLSTSKPLQSQQVFLARWRLRFFAHSPLVPLVCRCENSPEHLPGVSMFSLVSRRRGHRFALVTSMRQSLAFERIISTGASFRRSDLMARNNKCCGNLFVRRRLADTDAASSTLHAAPALGPRQRFGSTCCRCVSGRRAITSLMRLESDADVWRTAVCRLLLAFVGTTECSQRYGGGEGYCLHNLYCLPFTTAALGISWSCRNRRCLREKVPAEWGEEIKSIVRGIQLSEVISSALLTSCGRGRWTPVAPHRQVSTLRDIFWHVACPLRLRFCKTHVRDTRNGLVMGRYPITTMDIWTSRLTWPRELLLPASIRS